MAEILGLEVESIPSIDITGWLSNTWFYVLIVTIIGILLITGVFLILFFKTFNRKIVFFENIAGLGFQPTMKRRGRLVKVGQGGEELIALVGGETMSAYGRKMGTNTYWYAKGQDGYWYNFLMGDLDAKLAIMDIEPVDKDVRMFHVAKERMNRDNYLKKSLLERYGSTMIMFLFLVVLILGMWFIVGKIGDATAALSSTAATNAEVAKATSTALQTFANIQQGGTGLVPAG